MAAILGAFEKRFASCNIIAGGHDGSSSVLFTDQQGILVQKAETNERGTKVLQSEQPLEIFLLFQIRQIKSGQL